MIDEHLNWLHTKLSSFQYGTYNGINGVGAFDQMEV
jgi:hypothetical protein